MKLGWKIAVRKGISSSYDADLGEKPHFSRHRQYPVRALKVRQQQHHGYWELSIARPEARLRRNTDGCDGLLVSISLG